MRALSSKEGAHTDLRHSPSSKTDHSGKKEPNEPSPEIQCLIDKLSGTNIKDQAEAASALRAHTKDDPIIRLMLADGAGTDALVRLMWSDNPAIVEDVVTCMHNVTLSEAGHHAFLKQPCLDAMLHILKVGTATVKSNAAASLFNVGKNLGNAAVLAEMPDFLPSLVDLLQTGDLRGKKDACYALYCLTTPKKGKIAALDMDLIHVLLHVIDADEGGGMEEKAMAVISNLALCSEGRRQLSREETIGTFGEIVEAGSTRAKEEAVAVLYMLVQESEDVFQMVEREGMMPSLLNLAKNGKASTSGREKANALIRVLRQRRDTRNGYPSPIVQPVSPNSFKFPSSASLNVGRG